MDEELIYEVLAVVEEIPKGKVASYGQIACLIGKNNHARIVGKVLSISEYYGKYPCHRVVNAIGRLAPDFIEQHDLLINEGIIFKDNGCVDMKQCRWEIE